jgi:hypothetical protein
MLLGADCTSQEILRIYTGFEARQLRDRIQVDFGIIGGASCNGVQLERRSEHGDFEVIEIIQGVCGGSEFTEWYRFTDHSPLSNQKNIYRLIFGFSQGKSEEITIDFIPLQDLILLYPNPAKETVNVKFENTSAREAFLSVYNSRSELVFESFGIQGSEFKLDITDYPAGSYFLRLDLLGQYSRSKKFFVID